MSELKAVHAFDVYEAYTKTGDDDAAQVYLKSEADKVIAELKHQRDGAFGLTNSGLTLDDLSQMARKEIDKQKYKRCLDIAEWCSYKAKVFDQYARHTDYLPNIEKYRRKRNHYCNRCNNLLLLAEKFKEAK